MLPLLAPPTFTLYSICPAYTKFLNESLSGVVKHTQRIWGSSKKCPYFTSRGPDYDYNYCNTTVHARISMASPPHTLTHTHTHTHPPPPPPDLRMPICRAADRAAFVAREVRRRPALPTEKEPRCVGGWGNTLLPCFLQSIYSFSP